MQQLRKLQKLIIGMGESLLCYGAEISRVEETIQRVADHYQVEEVEMYVITNGLFVNLHQQEEYTYTRLKYVPSISVNLKNYVILMNCPAESNRKTCLLILPLNVCRRFRKQKMNRYGSWCFLPVWVQLRLVISLAEASGIAWQRLCAV